jgi:hypothetical protein
MPAVVPAVVHPCTSATPLCSLPCPLILLHRSLPRLCPEVCARLEQGLSLAALRHQPSPQALQCRHPGPKQVNPAAMPQRTRSAPSSLGAAGTDMALRSRPGIWCQAGARREAQGRAAGAASTGSRRQATRAVGAGSSIGGGRQLACRPAGRLGRPAAVRSASPAGPAPAAAAPAPPVSSRARPLPSRSPPSLPGCRRPAGAWGEPPGHGTAVWAAYLGWPERALRPAPGTEGPRETPRRLRRPRRGP